jgi:hypothetical protein
VETGGEEMSGDKRRRGEGWGGEGDYGSKYSV